jgi:hypothetical protein
MNRKGLIRLAGAALLGTAASLVAAQALEVIPLRHRTPEQVLPALRPLLEPGGTLSAYGNQLIVRTSPANLGELRRALETIDRPSRRLQISVRFDSAAQEAGGELGAAARIDNRGARVVVTGRESAGAAGDRVDQRVQVPDGGTALIYADATGFEVTPRVVGQHVMLDIAPQRAMGDSVQGVATTLTTRPGVWTELAGVRAMAPGRTDSRRIWVKVEEAPN